jgi:hypothetical protein
MDESSITAGLAGRLELIALAILIAGVIIARIASVGVGKLLAALDRRAARFATTETAVLSPKVIRVTRAFFFWLILVLAVSLALRVLGIGGISAGLGGVIEFAPKVLVAFSIIIVGHLLGLIASHLLSNLDDDMTSASVGPRLVHGAIVAIAIVMGLQHINVDISFVTRLLLILVGTVSAGLMLAFAFGAKQHVANLLARRELSRLSIGQRVRIDNVEGSIVDLYATGLDVATDDGIASVPAARLAETGVLRLDETEDNG